MAKNFTHNVCERSFRTQNGLDTHVICNAVAKSTPAPTQETDPVEKELIAELTLELMRTETKANGDPIGYVRAIKRATKVVKSLE